MENCYNGRTELVICYQWHMLDGGNDVEILCKNFDTLDEAYEEMERVMPDNYEGDDGYDLVEWNALIADNDPDIFMQYVSFVDNEHNFLAQLRPVL